MLLFNVLRSSHTRQNSSSRKHRLAVINSHPIQYSAPLYRLLANEPDIDLTVYFYSPMGAEEYVDAEFGKAIKWDTPLLEGYRHHFLPNLRRSNDVRGTTSMINPRIVGEILRNRYDAVWMHGYMFVSDWLALAASCFSGTPILYRSEASLYYDANVRRPLLLRIVKPRLLRFLFRRVARFLAIGTLNREFYIAHGARPEKVFHVPYTVDNDHFAQKTSEYQRQRDRIRAEMGLKPEDVTFLFAAKMTPQKAPLELLRAYQKLAEIPNKALIMAGDGKLRAEAEDYAARNGLSNVHFVGFANQSELPKYYGISDVFVRPDGLYKGDWGLTVNEAMVAGLAVIATDSIGASVDLVKSGENGILARFNDVDDLALAMKRLALDPKACREMGRRSSEIISNWSYRQCVEGVRAALESLNHEGA